MKTISKKHLGIFLWIGIQLLFCMGLLAKQPMCDTLDWKKTSEYLQDLVNEKSWAKAILYMEDHASCFENPRNPEYQILCLKNWSWAYLNLGNAERVLYVQQKMLTFIQEQAPQYYYQYLLGKMYNLKQDPQADMGNLYEEAQRASLDAGDPEGAMMAKIYYMNWLKNQGEERRAFEVAKEALSFHESNQLKSCDIYMSYSLLTLELKAAGIPAASMQMANGLRRKAEICMQSRNEWRKMVEFYMRLNAHYISLGMRSEAGKLVEKAYEISRDFPASGLTIEAGQAYFALKLESVQDEELREELIYLNKRAGVFYLEKHYMENRLHRAIMNTTEYRKDAALQKSIAELKEQALVQARRNNRLISYVLLVLAMLLISIVSIFLLFRSKVRQKQAIEARERELEAFRARYQGIQVERERVSKDLHDSVGSALVAARMQFQLGNRETADQLLTRAIGDVRSISHNLKPVYLEDTGVSEALRSLCKQWQSGDQSVHFYFMGEESEIPVSLKEPIYRICQELLMNAVKHARADNILIQLQQEKEKLTLIVEDDGKGFEESPESGIGLLNIEKRLSELEGGIQIHSEAGAGTSISISIPLNHYKSAVYGKDIIG